MADKDGNAIGNWRVRLQAAGITATENGRVRIHAECRITSFNGYWYSGLNVHGSVGINGVWRSADSNGLSLSQNGNVLIVQNDVWVSRTRSEQTVQVGAEVRVTGFAAGTSGATLAIKVPAKPKHTVSYNANGGTGAPGAQTKWWGEVLTLSNTRPTRANHTFLGWATSANGAVAYQPGGRFGADNNTTLYAKWKLATKPPTIQSFTAQRVDADGTPAESGTSVKLAATWKCDTSGDSSNTVQSVTVAVQNGGTWTETPVTASGATGTGMVTLTGLSADASWRFRVVVRDKYGTVSAYTTVGPQRFLLDFSADGRGIGIGAGAPAEGVAINGTPVTINGATMPRIYTGSKVITPSASSNRHTLFNENEWVNITGTSITEGHPTVLVSNGDVIAQNMAVTGAGYAPSTKTWYVWLASNVSTMFRVNYTILI